MLAIRMTRHGTKKRPFFHIVVADSRSPRDGRFIEKLGFYNPLLPKDHADRLRLDYDKVKAWMAKGAVATDRVHRFISDAGHAEKRAHSNPERAKPKKKAQDRAAGRAPAEGGAEAPAAEA